MGWLFSDRWLSRKDLGDHLINGNGVKTIKHRWVGCNLHCVHEHMNEQGETVRWACIYLTKGKKGSAHGYKDVDETMGPYQHDFPVSWLDLLSPCDSEYAVSWRENVRKRAEQMARFKIGTTWAYAGHEYTIIERRSPTSFRVKNEYGDTWRMKMSQLLHAEEVKK